VTAFVFVLCAPGAERALKEEVKQKGLPWVPSYQRSGFVTFKGPYTRTELVLAHEYSESLGKVASISDVTADLVRVMGTPARAPHDGEKVADIVTLSPEEIWAGTHLHDSTHSIYPGGNYPDVLPAEAPSRAYLKLEAVLEWAGFVPGAREVAIELGAAPGGASWSLLQRGLEVVGVDPGEMDPRILAHPRFRHVKNSINVLPPSALPQRADWIIADMNTTPNLTLRSARALVMRCLPRAMVLTIKLKTWDLARHVPTWIAEVERWGFTDVRAKQLSPHRQELALVAARV